MIDALPSSLRLLMLLQVSRIQAVRGAKRSGRHTWVKLDGSGGSNLCDG